ncbi:MAG: tRNA (adenosine(37)-N6)-threonylcarbamoyltransferase complex ATPase subunit type 1 TsaE [Sphaerochaetaceae bacterium]|jgi:tRNA threonylcarbamoyladenosine biosynthesis protein TsaE
MKFVSNSVEDTLMLGRRLGEACRPGAVISLRGSLGAGKTVIAKGVAEALGITEAIVSPTFTLVQEYEGSMPMYHMDLYRISGPEEFEMIGGEEMLYSDGIALIEWSEKIQSMLPDGTIYVNLEIMPDQSRIIDVEGIDL